jgi:hypothetical protein
MVVLSFGVDFHRISPEPARTDPVEIFDGN